MTLFLVGLLILIVGYFVYGRIVEKILAPDDRETPAFTNYDGVDYIGLPHWKNMLIQLLNIAGVGPIIGVILGIKFGAIVFLLIPLGNVFGGAVHDFVSGMMSIRNKGANLPKNIRINLGQKYYSFFSVFMILLLLLVVAVFVDVPAELINSLTPNSEFFYLSVVLIFAYYIIATLFPIDKIIGNLYPIFGGLLLIGSIAIFISMMYHAFQNPALLSESDAFQAGKFTTPIIPVLFVTIACGIMSGFHATQSPIIARTMKNERQARSSFYGMMIVEGIIGMIWAGAGMMIYNLFPEYMSINPNKVLHHITTYFLGNFVGAITIIAVIILAITSGDTAMRSLRLSIAEMLHIEQKSFSKRILLVVPLIFIISGLIWWGHLSAETFNRIWNYFAWGNQVLAASTLLGASAWLIGQGKNSIITIIPGAFMTFIVTSFILWTSPKHKGPIGFGLDLHVSYVIAGIITIGLVYFTYYMGKRLYNEKALDSSGVLIKHI